LASTATNGTCVVGPGRYVTSTLVLDRPLTVIGAGPGETILDSENPEGELLRIESDDVLVSSLQLRGGSYGILIDNASPVIRNLVVTGARCGINVTGADSAPTIRNNTLIRNGEGGIRLWGTGLSQVYNNIIGRNKHYGILSVGSLASVEYNDVFEHRADFEGLSPSPTNISADPRFAETRSYKLRPDSPCIGAGDPAGGEDDRQGSGPDVGAHGGRGSWDAKEHYWYPRLLAHRGVAAALTSDLCPDGPVLVMNEIRDLERGDTQHWQDLDNPDVSCLTLEDVKTVWARRVALNLFNEVNVRLPWSILDYDQGSLRMLLRLDDSCLWTQLPSMEVTEMLSTISGHEFVSVPDSTEYIFLWGWAANPLAFWEVLSDVLLQADPQTPLDAVASIIQFLRNLGWREPHPDPPALEVSHHVTPFGDLLWNLESFLDPSRAEGDCGLTSTLIRELARAWNIPASVGLSALGRHRGAYFPTVDRMLVHGDDVHRYPLTHYPAHHTLREVDWYLAAAAEGACAYSLLDNRRAFKEWFTYYQDPLFGPTLKDQFCNHRSRFEYHLTGPPADCAEGIDLESDPELLAWLQALEEEYGC
jgi:parallel beta-helix repeat protein